MKEFDKLYEAALNARNNSYSPYSKFKVGASVLLKDGIIVSGCNVENASYGLSMCAERNTIFSAVAKGYKKGDFVSLLVIADTDNVCSPCGACRQVISEFFPKDAPVCMCNLKGDKEEVTVSELLPFAFSEDDLDV